MMLINSIMVEWCVDFDWFIGLYVDYVLLVEKGCKLGKGLLCFFDFVVVLVVVWFELCICLVGVVGFVNLVWCCVWLGSCCCIDFELELWDCYFVWSCVVKLCGIWLQVFVKLMVDVFCVMVFSCLVVVVYCGVQVFLWSCV